MQKGEPSNNSAALKWLFLELFVQAGTWAQAWYELLAKQRDELFSAVRAADPAAAPDQRIEHPMFGPLTWREALLFTRLHDLDHAGQLQKIAAALAAPRPA